MALGYSGDELKQLIMEERMRIDKEKDASVSMNLNALIRRQPSN